MRWSAITGASSLLTFWFPLLSSFALFLLSWDGERWGLSQNWSIAAGLLGGSIFIFAIFVGIRGTLLSPDAPMRRSEESVTSLSQTGGVTTDTLGVAIGGERKSERQQPTVNHHVMSVGQSGGITAHTINISDRPKRMISSEFRSGILRDLPRDRPIVVFGQNGNSESMQFAGEIDSLLRENGYLMKEARVCSHMFFDPPVGDVKISPGNSGAEWWIVVGPAS